MSEALRNLQALVANPHEDLDIEIKGWLNPADPHDAANIAKSLLALANHGGGYLLIGFREESNSWEPDPDTSVPVSSYSQDTLNGIVQRFAEPPYQVRTTLVEDPTTGRSHPVVTVPGGHRVPIRAKRDGPDRAHVRQHGYYMRLPGPRSDRPQSARDWDELIRRCMLAAREDLMDALGRVLGTTTPEDPVPSAAERLRDWTESGLSRLEFLAGKAKSSIREGYNAGAWVFSYLVEPKLDLDLVDLPALMERLKGSETGWPPWWSPHGDNRPYPRNGLLECWFGDNVFERASNSDLWLVSREGAFFLVRGLEDDDKTDEHTPGEVLDVTIPVWRVGEAVLHAARLVNELNLTDVQIHMHVRWRGLGNRRLSSWASPDRYLSDGWVSKTRMVEATAVVTPEQLANDISGIVEQLTLPLFEAFGFFRPPESLVPREIEKLRNRS